MPIRTAATIVRTVVESMIALGIFDEPADIVDPRWRSANPCPAAVYHESLAQTIPWWRPLWRRRERARALQWRALCRTVNECDELTDTVVRLVRLGGPAADRAARMAILERARMDSGHDDPTPPDGTRAS